MAGNLPIGDLAREFAITTRAIRFYEASGLIRPGRRGTARVFGKAERERLAFIVRAKNVGLSLEQIREHLTIVDEAASTREPQALKVRCEQHIALLDEKRIDLAAALDQLKRARTSLANRIGVKRRKAPGT